MDWHGGGSFSAVVMTCDGRHGTSVFFCPGSFETAPANRAVRGSFEMRISRRSFLPLLGLTVFPRTAIAQAGARPPLVAVIWALPETDTRIPGSITAVQEGLAAQGWIDGLNVRLETRSGGLDTAVARAHAEELAGLDPQVFIAGAST